MNNDFFVPLALPKVLTLGSAKKKTSFFSLHFSRFFVPLQPKSIIRLCDV